MTAPDLFGTVAALDPRRARFSLRTFRVALDAPEGVRERPAALRGSREVHGVLRSIFATLDAHTESFVILAMDAKARPTGLKVVSTGSQSSSLVHPREVFIAALALDAAAVILAHNHPSGDAEPSPEDIGVTRRLSEVGVLVGIRVEDHLVLGDGCYVSFLDRGWMEAR